VVLPRSSRLVVDEAILFQPFQETGVENVGLTLVSHRVWHCVFLYSWSQGSRAYVTELRGRQLRTVPSRLDYVVCT
jgi:hypothetical protein